MRRRWRERFTALTRASFSSTSSASSSVIPRKSFASPVFQPAACNLLRFALFIAPSPITSYRQVAPQSRPAPLEHGFRCLLRRLGEHFQNHDRLQFDEVDDPPGPVRILNAQLVAGLADARHR